MKRVKADIHIHTVLSPCGDLEMSPQAIVEQAVARGLAIIGITDHNSTRQVKAIEGVAAEKGIYVLGGAEVTTAEEVHCLAYFRDEERRGKFQEYLDRHLPIIPNREGAFGYQVVVDRDGLILDFEERLLVVALDQDIHQVEREVHRLDGIFIPAHVDRPVNSLFSQLGFLPGGLKCEALGITRFANESEVRGKFNIDSTLALVKSSDAHYRADIGAGYTYLMLENIDFEEIRMALTQVDGRKVSNA